MVEVISTNAAATPWAAAHKSYFEISAHGALVSIADKGSQRGRSGRLYIVLGREPPIQACQPRELFRMNIHRQSPQTAF